MNTCKDCKHWGGHYRKEGDYGYADKSFCWISNQWAEDGDSEPITICVDRNFGCIHWEQKNE